MKIRNTIRKIGVTLSFICVIYYSYLPFLYIVNELSIEKNIIFMSIISMSLGFAMLYFLLSDMRIKNNLMIVIGLYILFSMYSLLSFILTPSYLDNLFTMRTLSVINPIFIILAFLCRNEKQYLLKLLYLASFSYVLFAIYAYLNADLVVGTHAFQDIFGLTENVPYQSINLYLGIFVVMTAVKAKYGETFLKMFLLYILLLGAIGVMLQIGGRTSFGAAMIVIMIFFTIEYWHDSLLGKLKKVFSLFVISVLLLMVSHFIIDLLKATTTFWRILVLFEGGDESLRLFLFSSAIDLFLLNVKNLFLGAGMNYFPIYIGANSLGMYPHNIILELLSEYGILGTLLFLSPIAYILLLRKSKLGNIYGRNATEKSIFLLVVYFWIIRMFTGGLRSSWVLIFFSYLLIPAARELRDKHICPNNLSSRTPANVGNGSFRVRLSGGTKRAG